MCLEAAPGLSRLDPLGDHEPQLHGDPTRWTGEPSHSPSGTPWLAIPGQSSRLWELQWQEVTEPSRPGDKNCRIWWLLLHLVNHMKSLNRLATTDLGHDCHVLPWHRFKMFDFESQVGQERMQFGHVSKLGHPNRWDLKLSQTYWFRGSDSERKTRGSVKLQQLIEALAATLEGHCSTERDESNYPLVTKHGNGKYIEIRYRGAISWKRFVCIYSV